MKIEDFLISKNYTSGREGKPIKRILLHTYAGFDRSLYDWFNTNNLDTSAHYAVFLDGGVERYVRDHDTAWHAGNYECNLESIGIEHQDNNKPEDSKRTKELYNSSSELVAILCTVFNIPCRLLSKEEKWEAGIAEHNFYTNTACPGGLDLKRIAKGANIILEDPFKLINLLIKNNYMGDIDFELLKRNINQKTHTIEFKDRVIQTFVDLNGKIFVRSAKIEEAPNFKWTELIQEGQTRGNLDQQIIGCYLFQFVSDSTGKKFSRYTEDGVEWTKFKRDVV